MKNKEAVEMLAKFYDGAVVVIKKEYGGGCHRVMYHRYSNGVDTYLLQQLTRKDALDNPRRPAYNVLYIHRENCKALLVNERQNDSLKFYNDYLLEEAVLVKREPVVPVEKYLDCEFVFDFMDQQIIKSEISAKIAKEDFATKVSWMDEGTITYEFRRDKSMNYYHGIYGYKCIRFANEDTEYDKMMELFDKFKNLINSDAKMGWEIRKLTSELMELFEKFKPGLPKDIFSKYRLINEFDEDYVNIEKAKCPLGKNKLYRITYLEDECKYIPVLVKANETETKEEEVFEPNKVFNEAVTNFKNKFVNGTANEGWEIRKAINEIIELSNSIDPNSEGFDDDIYEFYQKLIDMNYEYIDTDTANYPISKFGDYTIKYNEKNDKYYTKKF